jgi:3-hydroxyacyl-CoA dehydrogenase/3a,7a,12a-trihydroxy-5b-cholest-24-enoyl-CoA hydratase
MSDLNSAIVFEQLANIVKADSSLVGKVGVVLVYRITKGGKTHPYTADLKNGSGGVYAGEPKPPAKADCEITVSDDDFLGLVTKQSNAQNLFMQGKLKLKGNMAAGMKFEKVLSALPPTATGGAAPPAAARAETKTETKAPAAPAGGAFASKAIFDQLATVIKSDPSLVAKAGVVLVYRLTKGTTSGVWTVDLKNGSGGVYSGEPKAPAKADVELSLSDDDFVGLVTGKAKAQSLFMGGKLKMKGNMAAAMKFEKVLSALQPASKL